MKNLTKKLLTNLVDSHFNLMKVVFLFVVYSLTHTVPSYSASPYTGNESVQVGKTIYLNPAVNINGSAGGVVHEESLSITDSTVVWLEVDNTTSTKRLQVTGVKPGTTVISIKVVVGNTWYVATYIVTVFDVTSMTLPSNLTLKVGDSYTLTPIITDPRATVFPKTWKSTDENIASVSNDYTYTEGQIIHRVEGGEINAKSVGTCTVTCSYNGLIATCNLTIEPIYISNIEFEKDNIAIDLFQKANLTPSLFPENATSKELSWKSTNSAVAIVDANGNVTGVGSGKAAIICTAKDGSEITGSYIVEVNNNVNVADIDGNGVIDINDAVAIINMIISGK